MAALSSPAGRTIVARGFSPWNAPPPFPARRANESTKKHIRIKFNAMPAQQLRELSLKIESPMVFLLILNIRTHRCQR